VPLEDVLDHLRRMTDVNLAIDPGVHVQGTPPITLMGGGRR